QGDGNSVLKLMQLGKCTANCSILAVTEIYHATFAKSNGHYTNDLSLRLRTG
ncbi:hypothetical protein RYX36_013127, partial [Vicia faba]